MNSVRVHTDNKDDSRWLIVINSIIGSQNSKTYPCNVKEYRFFKNWFEYKLHLMRLRSRYVRRNRNWLYLDTFNLKRKLKNGDIIKIIKFPSFGIYPKDLIKIGDIGTVRSLTKRTFKIVLENGKSCPIWRKGFEYLQVIK